MTITILIVIAFNFGFVLGATWHSIHGRNQ